MKAFTHLSALLTSCLTLACVLSPAACGREPVDRLRELEIVEDLVVRDARARNAESGPFSFRHLATSLAGSEEEAAEDVRDAFTSLGEATTREIVCPWLREDATNQCDATCASCAARRLDLARAPLRLLAISNRLDLADKPDAVSRAGEARFVFGVTRGPGDDPRSTPRAMTIIVEYAVPETRSPAAWAAAWHALGANEGESYLRELEAITREITSARSLAQVRTNAAKGEPDPGMREIAIDERGHLRARSLRNTPARDVDESALASFMHDNADAILTDTHVLPEALRAARVDANSPAIAPRVATEIPDDVRSAFAAGTCNGCHGGKEESLDGAFHVSPFRSGAAKLSPFLDADLRRREADLRARLSR